MPRMSLATGNRFKLGLFGSNCSSGRTATTVAERWSGSWNDNLRMAQLADAGGIDFILPVARWKGYGGETDFEGYSLETLTWASALLARTERITVFGTVHTPLFHPVIAAKQMATADQVGDGRFGLNIVCGWNAGEFEMFGIPQREHDDRYAHGQEWIDAIKQIWSREEPFDFRGTYFDLKDVRAKPKPAGGGRPFIINAGQSDRGRAFAVRNCDAYFTGVKIATVDEATGIRLPAIKEATRIIAGVHALAAEADRDVRVFTRGEIFCRPTQREANDFFRYALEENVDWAGVDGFLASQGASRADPVAYEQRRQALVHSFPIIGDPDTVATMLVALSDAGFAGFAFSFINYADDLPYFCDEVLPRLERAGIRQSTTAGAV